MRLRMATPRWDRSHTVYNDQPFAGEGVSLYVTAGTSVIYRALRITGSGYLQQANWLIGTGSVTKTTRVSSGASPLTQLTATIDVSEDYVVDVRRYKDNVENPSDNYRIAHVTTDGSGDSVDAIYGVAYLLSVEKRDGGICRIHFVFEQAIDGLPALTLTAIRTAGPTSPSNVAIDADSGRQTYFIDTPVLSDASPYTYKIQAANGGTTADVITGITVTADATGPTAPTGSGEAW